MRARPVLLRGGALLAIALASACTDTHRAEERWPDAPVIYGVVPPLFAGTRPLRAVTERLDALKAIGVDALWLSPLQSTDDPSLISYAITDYFGLRADFGTEDDLRELVREAHARGLRVILDFVPNHTSVGHPAVKDVLARGSASPYWSWFRRDEAGELVHRFDWLHLAELDYASPEVRRMMIAAFVHWVERFDLDGFRIDAAWAIKDRAPEFWPELRAALDRVKPNLFLLAEAGAQDPYWLEHGFDGAYDWSAEIGHWAWEDAFTDLDAVGPKLARALSAPPAGAIDGRGALRRVARFLDNNDTGPRFVTRHGVEATKVAAVLQMTLPGIALLYTGEEVGAEYEPYEDPPPITWRDAHGLTPLYHRLATLRRKLPALAHGDLHPLAVGDHPSTFAFLRDAGPGARALVVLDFGRGAVLPLDLPTSCAGEWKDELSGRTVHLRPTAKGDVEVPIAKTSALVLTPVGTCTRESVR